MNYIFFAWFASILYAVEVFISKIVVKHSIKNPWLYNFFWALLITIFTSIIALFYHAGLPKELFMLLLATVFYELTGIFYVLALFGLDVSVLSPFFNIRVVFTVLLAAVFLGEILTPFQYLLIGMMFVCGIILTMDKSFSLKTFFSLPILYALLAMLSISFMGIFVKKSIALNGYWETNLWINVLGQIGLLATIPLFKKSLRSLTFKKIGSLSFIALCGALATLAANRAYASNVSITSVILSIPISMVMAIAFSFIKPSVLENHSLKVYTLRLTAAIFMIIAALKLSS